MEHGDCADEEVRRTVMSMAAQRIYGRRIGANARVHDPSDIDALFILGSGPSINELSDDDWAYISRHVSVGFNFWFAHPFVPDYYVAQITGNPRLDELMAQQLRTRKSDYKSCKFYVRGRRVNERRAHHSVFGHELFRSDLDVAPLSELYFKRVCPLNPAELFEALAEHGYFDGPLKRRPLPKMGATVMLIISMALRMRARTIVLCGIDMRDSRHFYDSPSYWHRSQAVKELSSLSSSPQAHEHLVKVDQVHSVKDHIVAARDWFEMARDGRIELASKASALYPQLDPHDFGR